MAASPSPPLPSLPSPPLQVYDVTEFVSRHPGGVDQIMLGAGRDATQLFESYHKLDTHR